MPNQGLKVTGSSRNDSYRLYYPGGAQKGRSNFERLYYVGEYDGLDGIDTLTVDWNLNPRNGKGARIDLSKQAQNEFRISLYTSLGDYTDFIIKNVESVRFQDTVWSPPPRQIKTTLKSDVLTGTAYKDLFEFSATPNYGLSVADKITNFSTAQRDVIRIDRRAFNIAANSNLNLRTINQANQLTQALATPSQFIYDNSTGFLYHNQNGTLSGAGTGGVFAIFENKPGLTQANIQIA